MSIYTKNGDCGKTSILKKTEGKAVMISKASPLIEAIGSVDEANSFLGIISSELKSKNSKLKSTTQNLKDIEKIQKNLFTIGSILAGADILLKNLKVENLETEIDKMEKQLPKLTAFILPGGSVLSAQIMYARALVRRAERNIVNFVNNAKLKSQKSKQQLKTQNSILKYMNRLSDYFFILARWENYRNNEKETMWK